MKWISGFVTALVFFAAPASGQEATADIRKGVADGLAAGRETSVLMPLSVGMGSAVTLALTDSDGINNNRVVTSMVVNTAISAGVTALASLLLPPKPSADQRRVLAQESALYANSWRSGFGRTASKRRFNANMLSILAGAATAVTIYSVRSK